MNESETITNGRAPVAEVAEAPGDGFSEAKLRDRVVARMLSKSVVREVQIGRASCRERV